MQFDRGGNGPVRRTPSVCCFNIMERFDLSLSRRQISTNACRKRARLPATEYSQNLSTPSSLSASCILASSARTAYSCGLCPAGAARTLFFSVQPPTMPWSMPCTVLLMVRTGRYNQGRTECQYLRARRTRWGRGRTLAVRGFRCIQDGNSLGGFYGGLSCSTTWS